ncbi:E3 SUMO-protein ligase PIAS2-like isoform X2 [Cotesia typhae]
MSSSQVIYYPPSDIRTTGSADSSTILSHLRDLSRASDHRSSSSSYRERSGRHRPENEVPSDRNPITTPGNGFPCSSSSCAPTYDRYSYDSSYVRYRDYPTRRDSLVKYETPGVNSAFSAYKSKSYNRYPKRPVPRYPENYIQYSSSSESEEVSGLSHGNRKYEPFPCDEPLNLCVSPKVDKPPPKEFKKLPFYDFISELMSPKKLEAFEGFYQQKEFYFKLNDRELNTLRGTEHLVNGKWEYKNKVLIRFALDKNTVLEDKLPPGLSVTVNGDAVVLNEYVDEDSKAQKQGPIDISFSVKLKPYRTNKIVIGWTEERRRNREYVVGIYLAQKNTCSDLLNRLKVLDRKDYDFAKNVVMNKLSENGAEIAMTDLCVSLTCPLGMIRMSTPCRGSQCMHLQCFDLSNFLQMNEHKPVWNCPICNKPTFYEDIVIDGYFYDILRSSKLKPETNEVKLRRDGSWDNFVSREKLVKKEDKAGEEVINVVSDDCSDDVPVIDLVSDEEDEGIRQKSIFKLEPYSPYDKYMANHICTIDKTVPNGSNYYF